jgi:hypothetical protein
LEAPAQPIPQQPLHPSTAKLHAGDPLDDDRDPCRGPHLAVEAMGASTLQQGLLDRRELAVGNRGPSARATAEQRRAATGLPASPPHGHGLPGHAYFLGDSRGRAALAEQFDGAGTDRLPLGALARPLRHLGAPPATPRPVRAPGPLQRLGRNREPVGGARWAATTQRQRLRPRGVEFLLIQLLIAAAMPLLQHPQRLAKCRARGGWCSG